MNNISLVKLYLTGDISSDLLVQDRIQTKQWRQDSRKNQQTSNEKQKEKTKKSDDRHACIGSTWLMIISTKSF